VLAAAAGCLFEPREAPPPCDPITDTDCRPPAVFIEPTEPEIVRDNIERALEAPTVEPNYRDSLTGVTASGGQFVYRPDNAVYELNPPLFDGWEEEREVQFMLNVLETGQNRARSVQVEFLEFFDTGVIPDGCTAGETAVLRRGDLGLCGRYEELLARQALGRAPPAASLRRPSVRGDAGDSPAGKGRHELDGDRVQCPGGRSSRSGTSTLALD
jgi:hypothetical protein